MLSHLHRQAGRGDALSCGLGTGLQENNCLHLLRAANLPLRLRQRSAKPPGFVTRARGSEAGIARRRGAEHKGWGIGAAPGPEAFHRPVNSPSQGMKKAFHPPEESSCKFLGNENAFFLTGNNIIRLRPATTHRQSISGARVEARVSCAVLKEMTALQTGPGPLSRDI